MKEHPGATRELVNMMEDDWLFYEPYVPKCVADDDYFELDENLPPHASCFRAAYNETVARTAEHKKNLMIKK